MFASPAKNSAQCTDVQGKLYNELVIKSYIFNQVEETNSLLPTNLNNLIINKRVTHFLDVQTINDLIRRQKDS